MISDSDNASISKPDLSVNVGGIRMKNPVTTASGTFGFGPEYAPYIDLNRLGAIVVKGTTLEPRAGNPTPRLVETPAGVLNSIGLQNPGVEHFIDEALPYLAGFDVPVIVNISGDTLEDYAGLAARLSRAGGVAGLEVNISCPNVKKGGMQFGGDPAMAAEVTRAVKENSELPVVVKLSPNVTSIAAVAEKVAEAGADAISLINTLLGMSVDIKTRRPILGNTMGGLSGPAVRPVAVRMVWQVYQAVKLPIIGMGGIATAADALEFILAGATAVAIGTANFVNPRATIDVLEGIEKYLSENGVGDIKELIGAAHG
ncbi:Dihydroorotate dehydrogenase B (NAD(+)), catalytic subunit [Pelotomaculum schinkii]|uniref:Dihydroorotate dehydrogenase n=1 Tax=Pelotomaculum schinkii TaxID=78350 RepID=A0A4Y7RAQ3_9FIRM|nr:MULTISPECIES: dihydroorotate dehydrogenase [Pelotomaculum]TEB05763.1 Dihydroorotate dehydrogenase B (NAD(+)), catalytic subunit [Pelotomaculum schinkii]TEB17933.1 Dihydroorotate dehydrogenase B (NAD(+)), catalytic subunit [Pelotomaculum sp. FP]